MTALKRPLQKTKEFLIRRGDFVLLPNLITLSRVIAIPLVGLLCYAQLNLWASGVFLLAGLTDYFDGWVARKYHYVSKLGMLLDPLADKLIIVSTLIMLLWLDRLTSSEIWFKGIWKYADLVPPLLVIVTVGREIAITGLRSIASSAGIVLAADRGGKVKTMIQFWAIFFLIVGVEPYLSIGLVLLVLSTIAALTSAFSYISRFIRGLPE